MKIIEYAKLIALLVEEEGLNPVSAYRNVQRIRLLPKEFKEAVLLTLNGGIPTIEVEGISFTYLIEKENMKPIRAILMLDWFRREPAVATRYMASQRMRSPIRPLTDDEKAKVNATLERLKKKAKEQPAKNTADIEI